MDKFGPRRLLSGGAAVCAVGCVLFALAPSVWLAVCGRLLMGTGAAFAFVGSLSLVGRWFPVQRFSAMVGIAETMGMLGSIVGGVALAGALNLLGWRIAMLVAAGISALLSWGIWSIVRDNPVTISEPEGGQQEAQDLLRDLKQLLSKREAWVNGLFSGLMFSIITVFVALWGVPFVMESHHVSLVLATFLVNMVFVGVAIGGPLMGWLDQQFQIRSFILVAAPVAAVVMMLSLIFGVTIPVPAVMLMMMVLGLCASCYVYTFTIAHEIAPPKLRAASIGFVNTLSVGSAPLLQPLVGWFMHMLSKGAQHGGTEVYSLQNYQMALLILPLLVLLAAGLARWMPRKRQL